MDRIVNYDKAHNRSRKPVPLYEGRMLKIVVEDDDDSD